MHRFQQNQIVLSLELRCVMILGKLPYTLFFLVLRNLGKVNFHPPERFRSDERLREILRLALDLDLDLVLWRLREAGIYTIKLHIFLT